MAAAFDRRVSYTQAADTCIRQHPNTHSAHRMASTHSVLTMHSTHSALTMHSTHSARPSTHLAQLLRHALEPGREAALHGLRQVAQPLGLDTQAGTTRGQSGRSAGRSGGPGGQAGRNMSGQGRIGVLMRLFGVRSARGHAVRGVMGQIYKQCIHRA